MSKTKSFLSINDWTLPEIHQIWQRATYYQQHQDAKQLMKGKVLGLAFAEPSTRTRLSFQAAWMRLGGSILDLGSQDASSQAKGESWADTIRVLSRYCDALVVRGSEQQLNTAAKVSVCPIINGGDGSGRHPTQLLVDGLMIYQQWGWPWPDLTWLLIGDFAYSRVMHSWFNWWQLWTNWRIQVIAPKALQIGSAEVARLMKCGHDIHQAEACELAWPKADILYITRWQRERWPDTLLIEHKRPVVDQRFIDYALKPTGLILHPLPRDARQDPPEFSDAILTDPRMAVFQQTESGMYCRMAILEYLFAS